VGTLQGIVSHNPLTCTVEIANTMKISMLKLVARARPWLAVAAVLLVLAVLRGRECRRGLQPGRSSA
jgi:hypothetical protein